MWDQMNFASSIKKVETYCKQMQNFWSNMPLGYYGPTHNSKTLKDGKVVGTSGVWCSIKWWRGLIGPIPWWLTVVGSLCSKWNGPGDIRYIESTQSGHKWNCEQNNTNPTQRKSLQKYKNKAPNLLTCNTEPWGHYGKEGPYDSTNYQAAGRLAPFVEGYNVLPHVKMMLQKLLYSF